MDDLISRQAAIDALKNRWKKTRNYEGVGDDIAEECELYLKQVPSAQPGWIPCSERLPEDITQVIIQTNGEAIHEAIYMGKDDYGHYVWKRPDNEIYWDEEVVAWMPLPTPYQPKEDICK